jgi:hypothetical protein
MDVVNILPPIKDITDLIERRICRIWHLLIEKYNLNPFNSLQSLYKILKFIKEKLNKNQNKNKNKNKNKFKIEKFFQLISGTQVQGEFINDFRPFKFDRVYKDFIDNLNYYFDSYLKEEDPFLYSLQGFIYDKLIYPGFVSDVSGFVYPCLSYSFQKFLPSYLFKDS